MAKIFGTFCLQFIYTYVHTDRTTADIYRFFDDGLILNDLAHTSLSGYVKVLFGLHNSNGFYRTDYFEKMNSWIKPFESGFYNDNIVMIKLNSILSLFTQSGYEVNSIVFSSLAFTGLLLLLSRFLQTSFQQGLALLVISILPSYLLLLSGGLKETFLLFGAGLFIIGVIPESEKKAGLGNIFNSIVGLIILLSIKPYFVASLMPALLAFTIVTWKKFGTLTQWLTWFVVMTLGFLALQILQIDLVEYVVRKQNDFINHSALIKPGSAITMEPLEYSFWSVLKSLPLALYRVLFEPIPSRINSVSLFIMAFENLLLFGIFIVAVWKRNFTPLKKPIFHLIAQGVIPALLLIGLISPVLGATMRYRAPFLVLLIIAIVPLLIKQMNTDET